MVMNGEFSTSGMIFATVSISEKLVYAGIVIADILYASVLLELTC